MEGDTLKKFEKMCERFDLSEENIKKAWETLDKLALGQINHNDRLENVEPRVDSLEIKFNHIIQKEDYMIKLLENMTAEQAANKHRSDRYEERIGVLEKDVKQLQVAVLP